MDKSDARPDFFAQGGSTPMFGRGTAHEVIPVSQVKNRMAVLRVKRLNVRVMVLTVKMFVMLKWWFRPHMFGKGHAGKKVPFISGKESQEG